MNKKNIVESVVKSINVTKKNSDIIEEIYKAKEEWQIASDYFNMVHDPQMVDYAIYSLDAARARYEYLLSQAKKRNIRVDYCTALKVINK